MSRGRPTVARIDLDAVRANLDEVRRRSPGREVIAVVKADAYGHGAGPVARTLRAAGCERLAVLSVAEAAALRDAGVDAPVLVMGGVHGVEEAREARALGVAPVLHGPEGLAWIAEAAGGSGPPLAVEIEVDTGMRRMGAPPEEAAQLAAAAAGTAGVRLSGVFTHLARADEPDPEPSRQQLRRFAEVLDAVRARGVDPGAVHVAASGGVLAWKSLEDASPPTRAVRPGLLLYGATPSPHVPAQLAPAMTLATRVVAVRRVRRGEGVGYGAIWRAPRDGRVATVAAGYADGVPRCLGEPGRPTAVVDVAGRRFPVAGRVSMDYVTLDLGSGEAANAVSVGDEAILFGRTATGDVLPVEEFAAAAGTIAYEIVSRVGARVPRRHHGAGAEEGNARGAGGGEARGADGGKA